VRGAAEHGWRDPVGSALLAFACAMCGVFVWMLLPLLLVTGGLLSLAAVAVDLRHHPGRHHPLPAQAEREEPLPH
jgi:hypothetical protein